MGEAKVLNGTVKAGDRVAYATRAGDRAAIHLGTVEEVTTRAGWNLVRTVLKIRIEHETGGPGVQKVRTVAELDRVIKL